MATLSEILSPVWSYSLAGGGAIAEGLASIRQCIDIIIRTTPGSDPLRPEFGSDVWRWIDAPADIAIPNIKKAIIDGVTAWERRVTITAITHELEISHLKINVNYRLTDSTISDLISIVVGNGGVATSVSPRRLVLQGLFPVNPNNYQYSAELILNSEVVLPSVPDAGFPDITSVFYWIKYNWSGYAQWYFTPDAIVGYVIPAYTSGILTISLLQKLRFFGKIPVADIGEVYSISVAVDGTVYTSESTIYTPDSILLWVVSNVPKGAWSLEPIPGSFNEDFGDDYDVYAKLLVIHTDQAKDVIINITTE